MTAWQWLETFCWFGFALSQWALWQRVRLLENQRHRDVRQSDNNSLSIDNLYAGLATHRAELNHQAAHLACHSACLDDHAAELAEVKARLGVPELAELTPLDWRLSRNNEN